MTALRQLADLLPPRWPLRGKGIKWEDWLAQAELDLLLGRDPKATGSDSILRRLGKLSHKGWSQNQIKTEATGLLMRDGDPRPLLSLLKDEQAQGMCYREQGARYQPRFHTRDALAALIDISRVPVMGSALRTLRDALRLWLSWEWYWLRRHSFEGRVYPCGCRREFAPEDLDSLQLDAFEGRPVNLSKTIDRPGEWTNGGFPRSTTEWLLVAAREAGLLAGLEPMEPPLAWPVVVEKSAERILSYFPKLHWRPGQGPILAAVEMQKSWKEPQLWLSPDKEPLPSEWWGFSPHTRRLEAAA